MTFYTFHDLTLEVRQEEEEPEQELARLLPGLSWVRNYSSVQHPSLRLAVYLNGKGCASALQARPVFEAEGFSGREHGEDFCLTDGSSYLHLQMAKGRGEAHLAPTFFTQPPVLRRNFWAFALLKLLRPLGLYSLHAAGVVSPTEEGILMVGQSGSGKSTLTIGLIRQGWRYLSDDAVLLRLQADEVTALALRKHCYVDAAAVAAYADLPLGEEIPDTAGGRRRRVCIEDVYPGQEMAGCIPRVMLFPRFVPHPYSTLLPLDRSRALRILLSYSNSQLLDRGTVAPHLEIMKRLVQQTAAYELQAGRDLHHNPGRLAHLLRETEGAGRWPGSL